MVEVGELNASSCSSQLIGPGVRLSSYLVSAEIGAGGSARVFRSEPVAGGGEPVAIKVPVRADLVRALRAEGAVLRRLQGPRFVRILEERLDESPPYFVLELCAGGDLRGRLDREPERRLHYSEVERLAALILEGVAFAHDEGLVHGDLKPENILLDARGEPKIADLGLSRAHRRERIARSGAVLGSIETAGGALSAAASSGKVRGTFDYLAPEVRGGGDITPASDVFALGVLLYEMLVGSRPLGLFQLPGEALAHEGIRLPPALDRVVARALAHDPHDRYEDAGEMLADLNAGAIGIPSSAAAQRSRDPGMNPLLLRVVRHGLVAGVLHAAILWLAFTPLLALGLLGAWRTADADILIPLAAGIAVLAGVIAAHYSGYRAQREAVLRRLQAELEEHRS